MKTYYIFIKSAKHPRTINTPMMGRVNYDIVTVKGNRENLENKVAELIAKGEVINEVRTPLGGYIYPKN